MDMSVVEKRIASYLAIVGDSDRGRKKQASSVSRPEEEAGASWAGINNGDLVKSLTI